MMLLLATGMDLARRSRRSGSPARRVLSNCPRPRLNWTTIPLADTRSCGRSSRSPLAEFTDRSSPRSAVRGPETGRMTRSVPASRTRLEPVRQVGLVVLGPNRQRRRQPAPATRGTLQTDAHIAVSALAPTAGRGRIPCVGCAGLRRRGHASASAGSRPRRRTSSRGPTRIDPGRAGSKERLRRADPSHCCRPHRAVVRTCPARLCQVTP
jgi:hypothetical protein